uniref:hypothetical protein n=1 Tax=Acinetobacter tandoii TaxID=202954 RepID=UPI003F499F5F
MSIKAFRCWGRLKILEKIVIDNIHSTKRQKLPIISPRKQVFGLHVIGVNFVLVHAKSKNAGVLSAF